MGWEWSRAPASEDVIDGVEVGCSYGGNIGGGGGETGACMRSEEVGRVPASEDVIDGVEVGCSCGSYEGNIGGGDGETLDW